MHVQYRELGLAVGGSLAGAQTRVLLSLQPSTENFVPMFAPLKGVYHDKSMTFYHVRCCFRRKQQSTNWSYIFAIFHQSAFQNGALAT